MPRQFSPKEIREWTEAYEKEGLSYADIAQKFNRDVRTIRKGIGESWQGREAQAARAHLVQTALRRHHDSLLDVFNEVQSALVVPSHTLTIPWRDTTDPMRLAISYASVDCHMDHPATVTVKINKEGDPLWELAHEHLRRDSVWDALDKWKQALASHIEARIALKRKIPALMSETTKLQLWKRNMDRPFLRPEGVDPLYQVAINHTVGVLDTTDLEAAIESNVNDGTVCFGPTVLAEVPGSEESTRSAILDAFYKLSQTDEAAQVVLSHQSLKETTEKARRIVQEIILLNLVPGQCRVCRRLGV